jgi:hypothetical protein
VKTKEDFFKFEKEQRKFFDNYYKSKGWRVERIKGKANKKYDCAIWTGKSWITIQEKVRSEDYGDLLVELTQDISTNNLGWLYTCKADFILYKTPDTLYWINNKKLKKHMREFGLNYRTIESKKGWGRTLNAVVSWDIILKNKIGDEIIFKKDENNLTFI